MGPLSVTLVSLCAAGPAPPTLAVTALPDHCVALGLTAGGETWRVALSLKGPCPLAAGDLEADALLAAAVTPTKTVGSCVIAPDVARLALAGARHLATGTRLPVFDS